MARIRTIKPEFWTDAKVVECSMPTRLFFIGLWTFADDAGNLEYCLPQLKMRIFPADPVEISGMVTELLTHGLLTEYSMNGNKYLSIKGFTKHQVINRPSFSKLLPAPLTEHSREDLEGKGSGTGKEGKGKEGKCAFGTCGNPTTRRDRNGIPYCLAHMPAK